MDKAIKDILDYRFIRGLVFGYILGIILGVLCSCQTIEGPKGDPGKDGFSQKILVVQQEYGVEIKTMNKDSIWISACLFNGKDGLTGPQGPIGPPGKDGISTKDTVFIFTKDTLVISHKDTVLYLQVDTVYAIQLDTIFVDKTDTVYINLSDSLTAPKGLLIGMVKTIYTDTCTVAWHHDWLRVDGVPCDSILFRVVLIHSDGATKLVQPDTPFLSKQAGAIKYLCTGIGLGQWTIWVRACRKNVEGTWIWSRWYVSSQDDFYIQRIVTPE